jgi:hypothetical protein
MSAWRLVGIHMCTSPSRHMLHPKMCAFRHLQRHEKAEKVIDVIASAVNRGCNAHASAVTQYRKQGPCVANESARPLEGADYSNRVSGQMQLCPPHSIGVATHAGLSSPASCETETPSTRMHHLPLPVQPKPQYVASLYHTYHL